MEITLLTISKQCSDIIKTSPLELDLDIPILRELYGKIYDLYPALDTTEYKLYWRYSKDTFYQISDYLSYVTVLTLMFDRTLYLLLNDCDAHCEDNEEFLRLLDKKELKAERDKLRHIYDVAIAAFKGEPEEEITLNSDEIPAMPRTDSSIIAYAIRALPVPKYFTSDLVFKSNLITAVKKGWPKLKLQLTQLDEEVIERAAEKKKDSKKKKDKKGKGGKKGNSKKSASSKSKGKKK